MQSICKDFFTSDILGISIQEKGDVRPVGCKNGGNMGFFDTQTPSPEGNKHIEFVIHVLMYK